MEKTSKVIRWNKAYDTNGNAVSKAFYEDGTAKMLNNADTRELENSMGTSSFSNFYKSRSGLRRSK